MQQPIEHLRGSDERACGPRGNLPDLRTLEAFENKDGRWLLLAPCENDNPVQLPSLDAISFPLGALWADEASLVDFDQDLLASLSGHDAEWVQAGSGTLPDLLDLDWLQRLLNTGRVFDSEGALLVWAAEDTVEERVHVLQERKRGQLEAVYTAAEQESERLRLTQRELLGLLEVGE